MIKSIYVYFPEATEAEVEKSKNKPKRKNRSKAVRSTPPKPSEITPSTPVPPSTPTPPSGNHREQKRVKGKSADPDKDRVIESLRQVGLG